VPFQKWSIAAEFTCHGEALAKPEGGFEPKEYRQYFEDSNPPSNAEIECKIPLWMGVSLPLQIKRNHLIWHGPTDILYQAIFDALRTGAISGSFFSNFPGIWTVIEGESTDANHQGWIEVRSCDNRITQKVSTTASSAGGATPLKLRGHPLKGQSREKTLHH
jgi:hypothetical protein